MPNNTISLALSPKDIEYIKSFYEPSLLPPKNEYMQFFVSMKDCSISVYNKIDSKGKYKVVFQGSRAEKEAEIFGYIPEKTSSPLSFKPNLQPKVHQAFVHQIGSDEVGTGDFFGPIVVCAAYVDEEGAKLCKELGITDSKKMDDAYIRAIGSKVSLAFDHSLLVLRNEKYNKVFASGINMNGMKAKMHNQCLLNVSARHPKAKIYQDQFAEPSLYFRYLRDEKNVVRDIHFETKAEHKYPSVAVASVIARYAFLNAMDELGKTLGEPVPLGAGPIVDAYARRIAKEKGLPEIEKAVKMNFANYSKLIG